MGLPAMAAGIGGPIEPVAIALVNAVVDGKADTTGEEKPIECALCGASSSTLNEKSLRSWRNAKKSLKHRKPNIFYNSLELRGNWYECNSKMAATTSKLDYLNEMRKHFQTNCKTKDFVAHNSKTPDNKYKGHNESVDQLCWHPTNPDLFVTASGDKTIRIWDTRSTKCAHVVNTKGENINICWSPDGSTIAVGNKDDLITFVDAKSFKARHDEQFKFEVNEISWNNTNDLFFLTNGHGCINILSYPDLKALQTLNAHPANCICIKFDPTGRYFATGSADALVSLWDVDELVCVRTFSRLDWPVRTLSFSHDGQMLASGSEDLIIDVAMVETGERICEVQCNSPTFTVAWHPSKPLLAFACDDKVQRGASPPLPSPIIFTSVTGSPSIASETT
ncbi:hypothetical protein QZH41_011182 [Actinostola sp. cb2023]|nr:hypothetical protein QZH41_011182 [Actinostola sp. cb2023]